ncbi:TPM domain-containing protein [Actinotalea sp. M2MS4P-6]|uniref:TPM domain-containing protein n=1 Tax=Actinotalea sp. M2MS4P-6 TaxID=2983762 RepID=UPI0021E48D8C|nr:TPM domain-containing protein [Actinotalea sp. M2MS4P-6]MCV2395080.1 TPM domain-containing protein [Actinotalea sp. M2MS4P-6]
MIGSAAPGPRVPRRRERWRTVAALVLTLLAGTLAAPAWADEPGNLPADLTDTAGVLSDSEATEVQDALDQLQADTGYQLFVAYVPSFDGMSAADWANETATASGLGRDDLLLAVAVDDRQYHLSVDDAIAFTDDQLGEIERTAEQHLAQDDWAGAAIATASAIEDAASGGTASGSSGGVSGLLVAGIIGLVVIGIFWFVASRRSRSRGTAADDTTKLPTAELGRRASAALVELDDAVKTSEQELGFAQAQFGVEATRRFTEVLAQATSSLAQAFALRQKLDDSEPETEPQARAMMTQILELCRSADEQLDAQADEFDRLRDLQSRAPQVLAETRQRADEVSSRLGGARATLSSLATTFTPAALSSVADNADQAEALLAGARESVDRGLAVVETDRAAAVGLARAAEDSVEQAVRLLDAVDHARADLAEAGTKVDAALASIGADVADAERLAPSDPAVTAAAGVARQVISEATAARQGGDLLAALRRLTEAEAALDAALGPAREAADRAERARAQLANTLGQVGTQIRSVADFIETRRGAVGAEARTRLAEAARLAQEAEKASATDPMVALPMAQRAGQLAGSAQQLAEADVRQWQASQQRGPGGGGSTTSMVLGGILLGQAMRGGTGGFGSPMRTPRGSRGGGFSAPHRGGRSAGSFGGGGTRGRRGGGGRF